MNTKQAIHSVLVLSLFIGAAVAADAPSASSDAQSKTNTTPTSLPEVTVRKKKEDPTAYAVPNATTATKTDTPIMQTPVSVQVVPQQVIKDQNIHSLSEALKNVSGVTAGSAYSGESFSIRGFNAGEPVYEEGARFSYGYTGGLIRDLANVERIEVLKGPASILYGQGEPGGLVNMVTKKPLHHRFYSLEQEMGSFGFYRTAVDATGPLTTNQSLLYRFNLSYLDAGSFRDFVETDRLNLYPTLLWEVSPQTQVILELHHGRGTEVGFDSGIPFIGGQRANIPLSRNLAEPDSNRNRADESSVKVGWLHEFNEDWKLRQYTKFENVDSFKNLMIVGPLGDPAVNGDLARFSQTFDYNRTKTCNTAIDLEGKFEEGWIRNTALVGADFYYLNNRLRRNIDENFPSINVFSPVYGQPRPPRDPANDITGDYSILAYGVYVQDQMELPGHIHLLAGGRFDRAQGDDNLAGTTTKDTPPVTPRFGLLWQAVPQLSLYTSYTENFGQSSYGLLTFDAKPLPAESAQQFEVGVKTELLNKRLTGTMSVYDLTKQNVLVPDPLHGMPFYIALGEVRSRGFEMDITGEINPGWNALFTYSYIDAQTTKGQDGRPGGRTAGVPYNSASLWTTYALKGPLKGLKLGGGVVARDSQPDYSGNTIPGYATVNLFANYRWTIGQTKVTAQLNIDNLFNKAYFASTDNIPGRPISALGTIRIEF